MAHETKKVPPSQQDLRKKSDKHVDDVRRIADLNAAAFARVLRGWLKDDTQRGKR